MSKTQSVTADLFRMFVPMHEGDRQLHCEADRDCQCGATSIRIKDGKRMLVCTTHMQAMICGERARAEKASTAPNFTPFIPLWCVRMAQLQVAGRLKLRNRGALCGVPDCRGYKKRGYQICARCLGAIEQVATDAGKPDLIPQKEIKAKPADVVESKTADQLAVSTTETLSEPQAESPVLETATPPTPPPAEPAPQLIITAKPEPAPQAKDEPKTGKKTAKAHIPTPFQPPANLVVRGSTAHHKGFSHSPFAGLAKFGGQASTVQNG